MTAHARYGGQVVCRIPTTVFAEFLDVFSDALRTGVPAELLDGLAAWHSSTTTAMSDSVSDRKEHLNAQVREVRNQLGNAEMLALSAKDNESAARWAKNVQKLSTRLKSLEVQLEELARRERPALPDAFKAETDFFRSVVKVLSNATGSVPREDSHNAGQIVVDRRFNVLPDGQLQAEVSVRLPIDGGVASLGPLRWVPKAQPHLSVPLMWAALEVSGHRAPWLNQSLPPRPVTTHRNTKSSTAADYHQGERTLLRGQWDLMKEALEEVGVVRMAHVLLACPFPAAPYVVLAHAKGEAAPSWVGPQWSDPLWMRWMHHVYTSDDTRWGAVGQYSYASWIRQAALDTALAHGGQVSKRTLLGALTDQNLGRGELSRISAPGGAISKGGSLTRAWHFPLTRVGNYTRGHRSPPGSEGEPGFAVIVCPTCAETATVATRVPEIFGDLLCPNGHMPLGGHDLLAGVVAPDEYQWLRVPRSIWSLRSRGRRGTGE